MGRANTEAPIAHTNAIVNLLNPASKNALILSLLSMRQTALELAECLALVVAADKLSVDGTRL